MIAIVRDPSGDMARLRCDRCGRRGAVLVFGGPRIPPDPAAFHPIRRAEASAGWAFLPSGDGDGGSTDLCRRCARAVRRGDDRPGGIRP